MSDLFNIAIHDLVTNPWPDDEGVPGADHNGLQGQIDFWRGNLSERIDDGHAEAVFLLADFNLYVAVEGLED